MYLSGQPTYPNVHAFHAVLLASYPGFQKGEGFEDHNLRNESTQCPDLLFKVAKYKRLSRCVHQCICIISDLFSIMFSTHAGTLVVTEYYRASKGI